jgi:hypothetical protein
MDGSLFRPEECGFKGFSFSFPGNEVAAYQCQSASAGPSRSDEVQSKSQIASLPPARSKNLARQSDVGIARFGVALGTT